MYSELCKSEICTKNKVAQQQAANLAQLFKYCISEGTEQVTPFIALLCEMGDERERMGKLRSGE